MFPEVGVLPRDEVFHPGEVVLFKRAPELDAGGDADVAEVVHREWNLHSDGVPHRRHVFRHLVNAFLSDFRGHEGVRQKRLLLLSQRRGTGHCPGNVFDHVNSQVHLEPRQAHFLLADSHALGIDLRVSRLRRVGVNSNFVAELPAEHLKDRHVVGFAGQVPQRHLDAGDSAALPRRPAKLLDLAEQPVHVARVFVEETALEEERIGGAGAIAHFAQTVNVLVRVQAQDGPLPLDHRHAQVGDFQLRRPRFGPHVSEGFFVGTLGQQRSAEHCCRALQNAAPVHFGFRCVVHGSLV